MFWFFTAIHVVEIQQHNLFGVVPEKDTNIKEFRGQFSGKLAMHKVEYAGRVTATHSQIEVANASS